MDLNLKREIKTLSPTSISSWLRCSGDWYNRYILKTPRGGTWNMAAGNCIHVGTYTMHTGGDWETATREFYEEHSELFSVEGSPSLVLMQTLLRVYNQMNPPIKGDLGEEYFKVQIDGIGPPLTGIFDLLPGKGHGIVEFKTGGWWTQARADLAMQTIHYSLAYKELFGRLPEFFHYYWFDFENRRVKKIETGVHPDDLTFFKEWLLELLPFMESSIITPKCLFTDNKQTCWYPETCEAILAEGRKRALRIDRSKSSSEGTAEC